MTAQTPQALARMIDHTLLKPQSTAQEVATLCQEAITHGFYSVCVNGAYVELATRLLSGSEVKVCVVVGFPLGAGTGRAKAFEAREAVELGAGEVDMVINIGALKSKDYATVYDDIARVARAIEGTPLKVILETGMLTQEEKIMGCALSKAAGAAFVKTSTGFGPGGATIEDIKLMRDLVGEHLGVKASGGIRDTQTAQAMIEAGASRLGCSSSVAIVHGERGQEGY